MLLRSTPFREVSSPFLEPRWHRGLGTPRAGGSSAALDDLQDVNIWHFFAQQNRISQLEDELKAVQCEIASRRFVPAATVVRNHEAIHRLTAQLFPGAEISESVETDPEIGDDEYFAILVACAGEIDEVAARHREWHTRVRSVAPETAAQYRLLIDVK